MCSRLLIDIVKMRKVFDILDQAQDSGKCLKPIYEQEKDKKVEVNWIDVEITDLKDLMKLVLANT